MCGRCEGMCGDVSVGDVRGCVGMCEECIGDVGMCEGCIGDVGMCEGCVRCVRDVWEM